MAGAERILALKLIGDVSDINKQMKGVTGRFKSMSHEAKQWTKAFAVSKVIDGITGVTDALGDAWDGFKSGQRVAAQLGNTWKNLGLDGSRLQSVLDQVTDSTLKLGTSDDEAVQAFNNSLLRTKDYEESLRRLRIAQDLVANGSAPNLSAAMKIIDKAATGSKLTVDKFGLTSKTASGRVAQLGRAVQGAAAKDAKLHPLRVTMNHLAEDAESLVGSLSEGNVQGALDALGDIGKTIGQAIFGYDRLIKKGKGKKRVTVGVEHVGGLLDSAEDIGNKLIDGIKTAIGNAVGSVDLSKLFSFDTLADGLHTAVQLVQTNQNVLGAIAIAGLALGTAWAAAMFTASLFMTAASAVFALPAWAAGTVVAAAVSAVGAALGLVFRGAMFVASEVAGLAATVMATLGTTDVVTAAVTATGAALGLVFRGAMFVADKVASAATGAFNAIAADKGLLNTAYSAGATFGHKITAGILSGLILADIVNMIADKLGLPQEVPSNLDRGRHFSDNVLGGGVRNGTTPKGHTVRGGGFASGTSSAAAGWHWVGEQGPELLHFKGGEQVRDHRQSMAMAGGGTIVNLTINTGVGDKVAIGREVDQALRAFYRASGGVTAR